MGMAGLYSPCGRFHPAVRLRMRPPPLRHKYNDRAYDQRGWAVCEESLACEAMGRTFCYPGTSEWMKNQLTGRACTPYGA